MFPPDHSDSSLLISFKAPVTNWDSLVCLLVYFLSSLENVRSWRAGNYPSFVDNRYVVDTELITAE